MNDKLYLNLTDGINNAFIRAAGRKIKAGDQAWASLSKKLNSEPKDAYWRD